MKMFKQLHLVSMIQHHHTVGILRETSASDILVVVIFVF